LLAFIVGLRAEGRLLDGQVFVGGGDAAGAARAASRAVDARARALVSFGLAGGLSPDAAPGMVLVPRHVLWRGRRFLADPTLSAALGGAACDAVLGEEGVVADATRKAGLWGEHGAHAVDLESGPVAEAADREGLPFGVLRAVCDPAWRDLPPAALAALDGGGVIGLGRVLRSIAGQPGQIGALLALARDAALARRALAARVAELRRCGALAAWG
jgi:adenosylhomocysteine nucleosidase